MPGAPDTVTMTSIADGQCHRITCDAVAVGISQRRGVYRAVCGARVIPIPMICMDGPSCIPCEMVIHAHRVLAGAMLNSPVHRCRHRRPGWLRQILPARRRAHPRTPNINRRGVTEMGRDRRDDKDRDDKDGDENKPGRHEDDREGQVHKETAKNINPSQYGQYETDDDG